MPLTLTLALVLAASTPYHAVLHSALHGPCTRLANAPAIRAVQESEAFTVAIERLRAVPAPWRPDLTQERIDDFCASMRGDQVRVPGGVTIVHFVMLHQHADQSAYFGVAGKEVVPLNELAGSAGTGPLDLEAWNRFVALRPFIIADKADAIGYSCLVLSLRVGDFPNDSCSGEGQFRISVRDRATFEVELALNRLRMSFTSTGKVVRVDPLR